MYLLQHLAHIHVHCNEYGNLFFTTAAVQVDQLSRLGCTPSAQSNISGQTHYCIGVYVFLSCFKLIVFALSQWKGKRQPLSIRGASASSPRLTTFPSVDAMRAIHRCYTGDPRPPAGVGMRCDLLQEQTFPSVTLAPDPLFTVTIDWRTRCCAMLYDVPTSLDCTIFSFRSEY